MRNRQNLIFLGIGLFIIGLISSTTFFTGANAQIPPAPSPPSSKIAPSYGTDIVISPGSSVSGCERTNSCYVPSQFASTLGDSVTWFNADSETHTVTSGTQDSGANGIFDSDLIMPGKTFSHQFNSVGSYDYMCMLHPWQTGKVVIKSASLYPTPLPKPVPTDTIPPKILQPTDIVVKAENPNGVYVTYDVLVIDETDRIVRPSCFPASSSFFPVGDTTVRCYAVDSAGNEADSVSFTITVISPTVIPVWVKNIAAFWCENKIADAAFIDGIQYLIENDIIIISRTPTEYGTSQGVPSWIKNSACWWSNGLISDLDFAYGIEFLIKQGIIRV